MWYAKTSRNSYRTNIDKLREIRTLVINCDTTKCGEVEILCKLFIAEK